MNCRDVQELTDPVFGDEQRDTSHEVQRHLNTCSTCRAELVARRRLRTSLRTAFERAPDLRPSTAFVAELGTGLRRAAVHGSRRVPDRRRWLALAATVALAVGMTGGVFLRRLPAADRLAEDAVGDHWNCALKHRLIRMPSPLGEAATRFDPAYRLCLSEPADTVSTVGGQVRVTERHSCAFGARRFAHVILQYRGSVVSLLLTAKDGDTTASVDARLAPQAFHLDRFSVIAIGTAQHETLLVSDLTGQDLEPLVQAIAIPLARHLERAALGS